MDLLDLALVKTRLEDAEAGLVSIGYAADFAAATAPGQVIRGPAAFLVITGEEPLQVLEGSGPLRQNIQVTLSVLLGVTLAGARGEAGLKALAGPIEAVRFALFGWAHPAAERAFHLAGGGVEDFDAKTGVLVYRLDFEAPVKIQEILP